MMYDPKPPRPPSEPHPLPYLSHWLATDRSSKSTYCIGASHRQGVTTGKCVRCHKGTVTSCKTLAETGVLCHYHVDSWRHPKHALHRVQDNTVGVLYGLHRVQDYTVGVLYGLHRVQGYTVGVHTGGGGFTIKSRDGQKCINMHLSSSCKRIKIKLNWATISKTCHTKALKLSKSKNIFLR